MKLFSGDRNTDLGHLMSGCSLPVSKLWPFGFVEYWKGFGNCLKPSIRGQDGRESPACSSAPPPPAPPPCALLLAHRQEARDPASRWYPAGISLLLISSGQNLAI